jgi:signal peptidase I
MNNDVLSRHFDHTIKSSKIWSGVAKSDSMLPLIKTGDLVTFNKILVSILHPLDIIAYRRPDGKIGVHRIIKVKNNHCLFITKGDNLPECDKPISNNDILGQVVSVNKSMKFRIRISRGSSLIVFYITRIMLLRKILNKLLNSEKFLMYWRKIYHEFT